MKFKHLNWEWKNKISERPLQCCYQLMQLVKESLKKGLKRIRTHHYLSDTGAVLYQLSYIKPTGDGLSVIHTFHFHPFISTGIWRIHKMTSSQLNWYLNWMRSVPVSKNSWVRIPFKPEFYSGFLKFLQFRNYVSCVHNCDGYSLIHGFVLLLNISTQFRH